MVLPGRLVPRTCKSTLGEKSPYIQESYDRIDKKDEQYDPVDPVDKNGA